MCSCFNRCPCVLCVVCGNVCKRVKGEGDRLQPYHTPIHMHKSILSEVYSMSVILSHSLSPPTSLREANPIHGNIIRALPCYLDSLPEPKRHTQGQIDFPVALDLWQLSRNHIAQLPSSPSTASISYAHTPTHHSFLLESLSNLEHPQDILLLMSH